MSILHVGHIQANITKRFKDFIEVSDVPPAERENFFLTRGLAAFVIAELSGCEDRVAAAAVLDGGGDNGIDALYFDPSELVCYLVQSKWIKSGNGSVDLGSALKFKKGVHDLFQGESDEFGSKMKRIWPQVEEILADSRVTFRLVVAYTGQQPLASEVQGPLDSLVAALNDPVELVSLNVLAQADLWDTIAKEARAETIDLQVMLKEFGTVRSPFMAYYGQVDLRDIATWGKFGSHLYAKNIRGFKGNTDVNDGMIATIKNSPQNFWYFNNGITIACSRVKPQPLGSGAQESRVFECEGASVVNGAQTVGSIINAFNNGANEVGDARVLVRIISLENGPETFGLELTRAANTQNRIENKDFVAQDPEQARLQSELYLEKSKRYVYRGGESIPSAEDGCTFEDAAVALACAHPDTLLSVQAKREVGRLWEDITRPPYKVLCNGATNAARMWRTVEIMRGVDAMLKNLHSAKGGRLKLVATHGNRFVLHVVCNLMPELFEGDFDPANKLLIKQVAEILHFLLQPARQFFVNSYPSNFFKNAKKCSEAAAILIHEKRPPQVATS
jgi:hypothetical protein